jgi:DNA-binding transcriptional ArsR family regulator
MNINQISRIASLIGEPARTAMLVELMDGRALTANELASAARVTAQTASRHLAQLAGAGLLQVKPVGRHRYHRLASKEVARILEEIMQIATKVAPTGRARVVVGPKDAALRIARTCYDHLAGRLGVAITDRLCAQGAIVIDGETGYLTDRGVDALSAFGIASTDAIASAGSPNRPACRPCLDWSERRFHVAGKLGALICAHCIDERWLLRRSGTRALEITPKGQAALSRWLGMEFWREVAG